jgi:CheY-like chemotaxis protein
MRVLFLDDMQARHDAAARWLEGQELVAVITASAAIEALIKGPRFDVVMLDHDLAEEHYLTLSEGISESRQPGQEAYTPGTGMDVVDFLVQQKRANAPNLPNQIIVHSWNPVRAPEMQRRLLEVGFRSYQIMFHPYRCPIKFG